MLSSGNGYYKGDVRYDTLEQFIEDRNAAASWASIAEELEYAARGALPPVADLVFEPSR